MATRKPIVNVAGTLRELPAGDGVAVGDVAGLGTAAAANLTTSKVDTTAGRVLKVGDFGLGEYAPILTKSQENTLLNGRCTFYSAQDESDLLTYSGGLQIGYTCPGYATQIASLMGVSVPILKVRVLNDDVWGQPVTLLHTNNLAQGVGGSTEYPMSQAATTTALNSLLHPVGDGNLHLPATGTGNNGKVLTAGATAGSATWQPLPTSPVVSVAGKTGAVTLAVADVGGLKVELDAKAPLNGVGASGNWPIDISGYSSGVMHLPYYSKKVTDLPQSYPLGVSSVYVRNEAGDEWFSYGTVLTVKACSSGGGTLQIYVPYDPDYGGTSLKFRTSPYRNSAGNGWADWKTLIDSDDPRLSGATPASAVTVQYDAQARVNKVTEDGVQTTIAYDAQGRVATVSYPRAGKTRTETYSYNAAGQISGMTAAEA